MQEAVQKQVAGGQYVVFRLDRELYGLPIHSVQEIVVLGEMTRLPQMAHYMEGVVNLRGRIVPVINLRRKLGLPETVAQCTNRIIVTELGDIEAGLIVDDVVGVVRIDAASVQSAPQIVLAADRQVMS